MQHFLSIDINQRGKEIARERERDTCRTAYVANVDTEGCTGAGRQTHLDLVYEVGLIQQINAHGHNPRGSTQAIHVAAGLILCCSSLKFMPRIAYAPRWATELSAFSLASARAEREKQEADTN